MPHETITPDIIAHLSNRQADRLNNLAALIEHQHAIPGYLGLRTIVDTTGANSSKIFTVPPDRIWRLASAYILFTATAEPGTRSILIDIRDPSPNVIGGQTLTPTQTAGGTLSWYIQPGGENQTTALFTRRTLSWPTELWLPEGYSIRVYDVAAVDPTGDTLRASMLLQEINA